MTDRLDKRVERLVADFDAYVAAVPPGWWPAPASASIRAVRLARRVATPTGLLDDRRFLEDLRIALGPREWGAFRPRPIPPIVELQRHLRQAGPAAERLRSISINGFTG